ncbi:MAG: preprotein translocase subunit SecG [Patescibacteria group bacterium]|nr:preprotein translocase subunit SecG [Patescibacteria group bacterium]
MQKYLQIIQVIVSILLIGAILLQGKGVGLSAVFGGESSVFRTKRGIEKTLFIITVILAVLFLGLGLANIFMAR